jgi:plasmid stabilization system protein ParE
MTDGVEIVRVLHGARDIDAIFGVGGEQSEE